MSRSTSQYITLRSENGKWGWRRKSPGSTFDSHDLFGSRREAEAVAMVVAECRGIAYMPAAAGGFDKATPDSDNTSPWRGKASRGWAGHGSAQQGTARPGKGSTEEGEGLFFPLDGPWTPIDVALGRVPGVELHRDYSGICDVCGKRAGVRWLGDDGQPPYYRHKKCQEAARQVRPASGGAPRAELEPDYDDMPPVPVGVGYGGEIRWSDDDMPFDFHTPADMPSGIDVDDIPF